MNLDDDPRVVKCRLCAKPLLQKAFVGHLDECKSRHAAEFAKLAPPGFSMAATPRDAKDPATTTKESPDPARKSTTTKKRKTTTSKEPGEKPSKKKSSDTTAATPKAKPKRGPIDLDRHCGVPVSNGEPCHRSITCKNHSVGLKRQVQGRSQSYDVLVELFQRSKNAPAQQPSAPAVAEVDVSKLEQLDPEAECGAVIEAIKRIQPVPLARQSPRWFRLRPMNAVFDALREAVQAAR